MESKCNLKESIYIMAMTSKNPSDRKIKVGGQSYWKFVRHGYIHTVTQTIRN